MALETREGPQLLVPLAVGAAAGAAVVGQMLFSPTPAQAANYVTTDVANRVDEMLPQISRDETLVRQSIPSKASETSLSEDSEDADFLVASLNPADDHPAFSPGGLAPIGGEAITLSGFTLPAGILSSSSAPSFAPFGDSPPPDATGSDGPVVSPSSSPANTPSNTNNSQTPQSQAALGVAAPAAGPSPTNSPSGLWNNDLNALAHGLANPLSPTKTPSSPPKHGPHVSPLAGTSSDPGIIAVGADAGSGPTVKVYDAKTLKLNFSFDAYASTFTGGVRVAVGVNSDGSSRIITAPGPGGGSLVKVWDGSNGTLLQSFNAYSAGQTDGVYVAAGDVNGDGAVDIITGTDVGAQPLVKVFNGKDDSLLTSFVSDPTAGPNGVRVAAANVDGDGDADIITGAGPGGPPRVTVVDGATGKEIWNFFAYDETFMGGVYVAAGDLNGDGKADIITGEGAGGLPQVNAYSGATLASLGSFLAYDSSFTGGVPLPEFPVTLAA
jgi:hypothetical protein